MYAVSMDLALTRVSKVTRNAERVFSLPGVLVLPLLWITSGLSALALRRFSREISQSVINVAEIAAIVAKHQEDPDLIDPEGVISARLLSMREKPRAIHGKAVGLLREVQKVHPSSVVLIAAARQLSAVCNELFDALTELYWEISEHDASFAPRREGFVASTPDEVNAVLDRIMAGE